MKKSEGILKLSDDKALSVFHNKEKLNLITYNIGYASGLKNNQALAWTKSEIEENLKAMTLALQKADPDLVFLQEVDFDAKRTFHINQMDVLAKQLHLPYVAYAITWNKHYLPWPYGLPSKNYGQMLSGQAILSRYPILKQEVLKFAKPSRNPFWYNWFYLDRIAQRIEVEMPNKDIFIFYNVHLEAFDSPERLVQINRLLDWVKKETTSFLWVAGDFNSTSYSISQSVEESPEALNIFIEKSGLTNAETKDPFYTFPSNQPARKIDQIFYRSGKIELERVGNIMPLTASDHLPVSAIFRLY